MTVERQIEKETGQKANGTGPVVVKPQPARTPTPEQPFIISVGPLTEDEGYTYYLIYGPSGAGKTHLASTAQLVPQMKRVIFLNIEAGEKSIVSSDVVRIRITDFHTVNRFYEWLRIYCRARDSGDQDKVREVCERVGIPVDDYRTVIIDTLSELQTLQIYQHLQINQDMAFDSEIPTIEWTEWNGLYDQFRLMIRKFRDLAMNVIIVVGEQEVDTSPPTARGQKAPTINVRKILKRPELQGRRLPNEVLKYFDLVGYLQEAVDDQGQTQRRLFIRKRNDTFHAKNRLKGNPPPYLDNPTMQDLYNLEVKSRNAANATAAASSDQQRPPSSASSTQAGAGGGGGPVRRDVGGSGDGGNGQRRVVRPDRGR